MLFTPYTNNLILPQQTEKNYINNERFVTTVDRSFITLKIDLSKSGLSASNISLSYMKIASLSVDEGAKIISVAFENKKNLFAICIAWRFFTVN